MCLTGDHIFYNKESNTYKIIDYGFFNDVKRTDDKEKLVELIIGWMPVLLNYGKDYRSHDVEEVRGELIIGPGTSIENKPLYNLNLDDRDS